MQYAPLGHWISELQPVFQICYVVVAPIVAIVLWWREPRKMLTLASLVLGAIMAFLLELFGHYGFQEQWPLQLSIMSLSLGLCFYCLLDALELKAFELVKTTR